MSNYGIMTTGERVALTVFLALVFAIVWGGLGWCMDGQSVGIACGLFGVFVGACLGLIIE